MAAHSSTGGTTTRVTTPRHYLLCPPRYFQISYEINPWMDASRPVDPDRALQQWTALRDTYRDLGHRVEEIDPLPGLPDMVYAANGATVVDGLVYSARFRYRERAAEAPAYQKWFADHGYVTHTAAQVNEGEGDLLLAGDRILAGTGFRTERTAHAEVERLVGLPVVSLDLVDPRFYHLDTALAVLAEGAGQDDPATIAYFPGAFSPGSRTVLERLFPDALVATEEDACAFGLNAVSDGRHVVLARGADHLTGLLRERGFEPIELDMSELLRGGGSVKCCTLEIRGEGR